MFLSGVRAIKCTGCRQRHFLLAGSIIVTAVVPALGPKSYQVLDIYVSYNICSFFDIVSCSMSGTCSHDERPGPFRVQHVFQA